MGRIDILDRQFFAEPARFAELINTELYQGREVLQPKRLQLLKRSYPSLVSASGEKERDILMYDTGQNICYGLELETESDYSMPERVLVYDACEYEYQIRENCTGHRKRKDYKEYRDRKSRMKRSDLLIPAMTMVLYLGEGHWCGRMRLKELFGTAKEGRRRTGLMLQDYRFPLIEADAVNIQNYRTDLKEFFQAMQCRGKREKLKELCRMESFQNLCRETEIVISAHLNNKTLLKKVEEEGAHMCKALDDWLKEEKRNGKREGRKEGRREGRKEERIRIVHSLRLEGMEEEIIKRVTGCSPEEYAAAGE